MKEMGRNQQLRTGEVLIIVVVLFMWAWRPGRLWEGAQGLELHMKRTSFPGSKESSFLGNQLCPVL